MVPNVRCSGPNTSWSCWLVVRAALCASLVGSACGGGSASRPAPRPAGDEASECVGGGSGHLPIPGPASFGTTADARRVSTFALAATLLGTTADSAAGGLVDVCAQIAIAAGMSEQEVGAGATDSLEGVRTVCHRAAERARRELDALRAAGATVQAQGGTVLDQCSLGGFGECVTSCDATFQSSPSSVSCEGVARGACRGGACRGRCETSLDPAAACAGTCNGSCDGTCTPAGSEPPGCEGRCDGRCGGTCITEGQAECTGECAGSCEGTWEGDVACRGEPRATAAANAACVASCVAYSAVMRDHPEGDRGHIRITGAPAASAERVAAMIEPISENLTRLGYQRNTLRLQIAATTALLSANPPITDAAEGVSEAGRRCDRSTRALATESLSKRRAILTIVEEVLAALGAEG